VHQLFPYFASLPAVVFTVSDGQSSWCVFVHQAGDASAVSIVVGLTLVLIIWATMKRYQLIDYHLMC